uniref:Histone H1 n=1 Tax=Rhabditophanes sp. KR3021 TaxID=114890 RepID=A0AC35U1V4_9BILA
MPQVTGRSASELAAEFDEGVTEFTSGSKKTKTEARESDKGESSNRADRMIVNNATNGEEKRKEANKS